MNIWIFLLTVWITIDIVRYIRYVFACHKLNNHQPDRDTNHTNIKTMIEDLKQDQTLLANTIMDIFFFKVKLEDMKYDDVCEALFDLFSRNSVYKNDIKQMVKSLRMTEKKNGRVIFNGSKYHNRLCRDSNKLKTWFPILPIYLITRGFGLVITTYMKLLGYKYYVFKSGLKIWYNSYDKQKGVPLVFFHPSVGGVSLQVTVLKYFHNTHNIIMPEIPGVSFLDSSDKPPALSEIVKDVYTFLTDHYIEKNLVSNDDGKTLFHLDRSKFKINLMGNSLGCSICAAYINVHPKTVDNFFCVEGQIFFPRALRIFAAFDTHIGEIPSTDLISVPLFHRDLYVQYFMIKRLTLDFACMFELNKEDNKHIKIHMYHIKDDQRILIRPQLEYAKKKKINLTYHLFDGDFAHGAFVLSPDFKKYVINDIQQVYNAQDHFSCNILSSNPVEPSSEWDETVNENKGNVMICTNQLNRSLNNQQIEKSLFSSQTQNNNEANTHTEKSSGEEIFSPTIRSLMSSAASSESHASTEMDISCVD